MKSYRIVLTYTGPDDDILTGHPGEWDWDILLNIGIEETISVDEIIEVPATNLNEGK